MRRLVGITCGLVALAAAPTMAWADDPPPLPPSQPAAEGAVTESTTATIDMVHLRSGGMFRGRVTEIVPGDHVTVLLTTGESRRIAWRDVERVIVASTAIPPVAAPSAPATAPMSGPRARVHMKTPHPAHLYRRAAGTTDFVTACDSPCDEEMPIGDTYRIGGSGFATTPEFRLNAAPGGSVELTVDGPSWAGIIGGGALTIGGGFTAYVGTILALSGGACSSSSSGYRSSNGSCDSMRNVGIGALAVGAGMIVLGLVIVFPSMKTDFSQSAGTPAKDAFLRVPTWRTASSTEGGTPATFPLLYEGRF